MYLMASRSRSDAVLMSTRAACGLACGAAVVGAGGAGRLDGCGVCAETGAVSSSASAAAAIERLHHSCVLSRRVGCSPEEALVEQSFAEKVLQLLQPGEGAALEIVLRQTDSLEDAEQLGGAMVGVVAAIELRQMGRESCRS
jgi:hypothetical protein